jgi:hypothetical protein
MSNKQQKKDRETLVELACSIQNRAIITDKQNRFYGKAVEETNSISDFYHPDLSSHEEVKESAKYFLDQVRVSEVGCGKYPKKYQSILSVGIQEDVVAIKNLDDSPYEGDTIDGVTRIVLGGEIERKNPNTSTVDVPTILIIDLSLIKLIRRKKKFFQNLLNDHLPCDSASKPTIMSYIKEQINKSADPNTESFKEDLLDDVYTMVQNNRNQDTVKDWIAEAYRDIERNNNGIQSFRVQSDRHTRIRQALEKSPLPGIANNWKKDEGLAHKKYKIYSVRCDQGNIEKSSGTESVRKGEGTDTRKSILIHHSTATTSKKIRESQQKVTNKIDHIDTQNVNGQLFDYVFALGQIKSVDAGKLLTRDDIFQCNLKVVKESVAK